jgi:hypothetical protein
MSINYSVHALPWREPTSDIGAMLSGFVFGNTADRNYSFNQGPHVQLGMGPSEWRDPAIIFLKR